MVCLVALVLPDTNYIFAGVFKCYAFSYVCLKLFSSVASVFCVLWFFLNVFVWNYRYWPWRWSAEKKGIRRCRMLSFGSYYVKYSCQWSKMSDKEYCLHFIYSFLFILNRRPTYVAAHILFHCYIYISFAVQVIYDLLFSVCKIHNILSRLPRFLFLIVNKCLILSLWCHMAVLFSYLSVRLTDDCLFNLLLLAMSLHNTAWPTFFIHSDLILLAKKVIQNLLFEKYHGLL